MMTMIPTSLQHFRQVRWGENRTGWVNAVLAGMLAGGLLPGGMDGIVVPNGSVASILWNWLMMGLIPLAYGPVMAWLQPSLPGARWLGSARWLVFWFVWAAIGYRWLLTVDLHHGLGLQGWVAKGAAIGFWLCHSLYWGVMWTVPFVLTVWLTHQWQGARWGWIVRVCGVMGLMAIWWPVLLNRSVTIAWLTPALGLSNLSPVYLRCLAGVSYRQGTIGLLAMGAVGAWLWRVLPRRWVFITVLGYWAGMIGLDSIEVPRPKPFEPLKSIAIVQGNSPLASIRSSNSTVRRSLESHYQHLAQQATQPIDNQRSLTLLVLPEEGMLAQSLQETSHGTLQGLARWRHLAKHRQVSILLGAAVRHVNSKQTNELILLSPQGQVIGRQAKQWLVPYGEYYPGWRYWHGAYQSLFPRAKGLAQFTPGPHRPPLMVAKSLRIGALNCVEVVDEPLADHFKQQGANVLTVSANLGWFAINTPLGRPLAHQLIGHAQWRSLQTGLPVLLASNTGYSSMILPSGILIGLLPVNQSDILDLLHKSPGWKICRGTRSATMRCAR
jgi:apolipoprotein N-acyltransferase